MKKLSTRSQAAVKANRTRAARKELNTTSEYADVVQLVLEGRTTDEIVDIAWVTTRTVAAVRANLSRNGRLRDLALRCNF